MALDDAIGWTFVLLAVAIILALAITWRSIGGF